MTDTDQERLLAVVELLQPRLAAFARERYAIEGRGLVVLALPKVSMGMGPAVALAEMGYQTAQGLAALLQTPALRPGPEEADGDITQRMVETYDPDRQAVIMAAFQDGFPVSVKMRLEPPPVLPEADGVH